MGRKRIVEIEKEENRKIAEMVLKLIGYRSYKDAALDAGIDPSTLSYICRGKVKPTPDVIVKLTEEAAHPQGGITCEDLMIECGYQTNAVERLSIYYETILDGEKVAGETREEYTQNAIKKIKEKFAVANQLVQVTIMSEILRAGYGIKAIKKIEPKESIKLNPDLAYELTDNKQGICEWWFVMDLANPKIQSNYYVIAQIERALFFDCDRSRVKISVVVDSKYNFDLFKRWEDKIPYRGELSVVQIDRTSGTVVDEMYLAHYDENDKSRELKLV